MQQPGGACSMPSRTFLADTSCLQADFLSAHTQRDLRHEQKQYTDLYHTNGKYNISAHDVCKGISSKKINNVIRN